MSLFNILLYFFFFFSSRRRHTRCSRDWSSDVCSSDLQSILMGGYWQTYVFAALQPVDTIIPLPFEGDEVRIPWTRQKLAQTEQIVIEYRQSKFAPGNSPPPTTTQYGNLLTLADPRFYE